MFNIENIKVSVLTEDYAKEICKWKYSGEYAVYNFSDWDIVVANRWGLSIKEKREKEFLAFLSANELIAYGRIHVDNDKAFIGIGLKPKLCGYGYGKYIMGLLVEESKSRFPNLRIALIVRNFNKRALKCYEKVGFKVKDEYVKDTLNGTSRFYYMEL